MSYGMSVQITKAMHVDVDMSGSIPKLRFRNRETYMSTKTAEYDDQVQSASSNPCLEAGCKCGMAFLYEVLPLHDGIVSLQNRK